MGSPPSLFNGSCCSVVKRMTQEDALYAIIAVENSMLKTQDQEFPSSHGRITSTKNGNVELPAAISLSVLLTGEQSSVGVFRMSCY